MAPSGTDEEDQPFSRCTVHYNLTSILADETGARNACFVIWKEYHIG